MLTSCGPISGRNNYCRTSLFKILLHKPQNSSCSSVLHILNSRQKNTKFSHNDDDRWARQSRTSIKIIRLDNKQLQYQSTVMKIVDGDIHIYYIYEWMTMKHRYLAWNNEWWSKAKCRALVFVHILSVSQSHMHRTVLSSIIHARS